MASRYGESERPYRGMLANKNNNTYARLHIFLYGAIFFLII